MPGLLPPAISGRRIYFSQRRWEPAPNFATMDRTASRSLGYCNFDAIHEPHRASTRSDGLLRAAL
jgi:hypothetical protein